LRLDSPGPGNYEQNSGYVKETTVSYKFGAGSRNEIVEKSKSEMPGPGNYDSPSKSNGPSYTISGRSKERRDNQLPGPGNYSPKQEASKERAFAYSMGKTERSEVVSKSHSQLPGPGNYDGPSSLGHGPKFTFSGKAEEKLINYNPGPGTYDDTYAKVKGSNPSFRMGTAGRGDSPGKERGDSPGPGMYDGDKMKSSVSYTLGGKANDPKSNGYPGPGSYEADSSRIRTQNPSVGFGSSPSRTVHGSPYKSTGEHGDGLDPRDFIDPKHDPGVAYSFGKEEQRPPAEGTPGPGQYYLPVKLANVNKYVLPNQSEEFKWV